MNEALLYILLFSTWGLGISTWAILLAIKVSKTGQELELTKLSIQRKRMKMTDDLIGQVRNRLMGASPSPSLGLSSRLQDLIKTAGSHPEVGEIDHNDLIIGVRFEGADYPPSVDDDEDEDS